MANLISPGDSARDNEYLQLAESHKYNSELTCTIAELRPGLYALYQFAQPLYIGEDWNELLAYYKARPKYVNRSYRPSSTKPPSAREKAKTRAENTARFLAALTAKGANNDQQTGSD